MASVQPRVGDRVRIVNYAFGEDVGEMAHPNGRTGEIVSHNPYSAFLDVKLDEPLRIGEFMADNLLVEAREIEVINV